MKGSRVRQAADRGNSTAKRPLIRASLAIRCDSMRGQSRAMRNAIALVLIARNEERCIARCLASARAHVDEMIVLDTGSTDATREIAARCGARVSSAA